MSESSVVNESGAPAASAGAMLRQARQAQGMHIAALAAAIKVTPRKLELLETDQFDQLPDATFTRALAQTVCRALKIDPAPVLALLPLARGQRLEDVGTGLNAPFRDRPGRMAPKEWGLLGSPVAWLAALIVLAALAVYFLPAHWLPQRARDGLRLGGSASAPAAASEAASTVSETVGSNAAEGSGSGANSGTNVATNGAASGASTGATAASAVTPAATTNAAMSGAFPPPGAAESPVDNAGGSTPATVGAASKDAASKDTAAASAPINPGGVLQLRPSAQSWVEVTDGRGTVLISRLMEPGEAVGLDGTPPFKMKVGNAGATQIVYRGRSIELTPYIRDNVARFELK
jgi:cytoskeleton protein RodZ